MGFLQSIKRRLENIIFLWIQLPLLKLRHRLELSEFKAARDVRNQGLAAVQAELRLHQYPSLLPGDDETVDDILFVAACELCDMAATGVEPPFIAQHRASVDTLKQQAPNLPHCTATRIRVLELNLYLAKLADAAASPNADKYRAAICALGAEPHELDRRDLYQSDKDFRRRIKTIHESIASERAPKFDIPMEAFAPALSICSAVFLVSGYLYNWKVLGNFGINVSLFFGLADYLAASIENVRYAAFAALAPIAGVVLGLVDRSRMSARRRKQEVKSSQLVYWGTALMALTAAVVNYFLDQRAQFFLAAELLVVVLAFELSTRVAKHFTNPLPAFLAMTALTIYAGTLTVGVYRNIYKVEMELAQPNSNRRETVVLETPLPSRIESLVLITANTSYFFFVDRTSNAGVIIPKDKVKAVTTSPPS